MLCHSANRRDPGGQFGGPAEGSSMRRKLTEGELAEEGARRTLQRPSCPRARRSRAQRDVREHNRMSASTTECPRAQPNVREYMRAPARVRTAAQARRREREQLARARQREHGSASTTPRAHSSANTTSRAHGAALSTMRSQNTVKLGVARGARPAELPIHPIEHTLSSRM